MVILGGRVFLMSEVPLYTDRFQKERDSQAAVARLLRASIHSLASQHSLDNRTTRFCL